jgi:outer membrane protein, heavy metal efflux system
MRTAWSWIIAAAIAGVLAPRAGAADAITLAECRALALRANPDLAAAAAATDAAAGAWRQSRAWPNPELAAETEDFGGDLPRWSESSTTYTLAQRLAPFGSRSALARAGRFGLLAAQAGQELAERELLAETDRRFAGLLAAQARREILRENARIADTLLTVVAALVHAGEASPIDAERARADQTLARIDLDASELACSQSRLALAELLGQSRPQFDAAEGALEIDLALPAWDEAGAAVPDAPQLRWWEAETSRCAAMLSAARRSRLPELVVGAGYRRFASSGDATYLASLALELPLLDRKRGAIEEAAARVRQAESGRAAAATRRATRGAAAHAALQSALTQARMMSESIVPGTAEVYRALNEGYQRGKFSLLDVLDARRRLADARLRAIDTWTAVAAARAELESILATPLEERKGRTQ